jgi:CheY-like chemotaxis protein
MPNKVLVVDDDPVTCELISEVLNSAEIETTAHTISSEAALQLRQRKFDAAFLDVRMPRPDGIELAAEIRSSDLNRKTVIVMITGESDQQFLKRAFEVGANFVLFKPVDRHALLRLLRVVKEPIDRERYRFARVNVRRKVLMECGQKRAEGVTEDLSSNGMLVEATQLFPVGTSLQINLQLESSMPALRAGARVVRHTKDNHMGLLLENISATERVKLQEFLLPLIPTD